MDIRDIQRGALRSLFGMVLQDTWLFNGTIRDNIAYGREGATEAEIVQAAQAAHADHFIRTLPDGYDTILNEEASNISQGQKQLLTIARAILADPAILILDEATSSVDSRTEVLIQQAMAALMQGRTSFVIAHRLSTIRDADLILVMNQGQHHRAGQPPGTAGQGRLLRRPVQQPVRGRRHRRRDTDSRLKDACYRGVGYDTAGSRGRPAGAARRMHRVDPNGLLPTPLRASSAAPPSGHGSASAAPRRDDRDSLVRRRKGRAPPHEPRRRAPPRDELRWYNRRGARHAPTPLAPGAARTVNGVALVGA